MTSLKLASILNYHVLKIDMSEYKEGHSISKMIGSPPGYIGYEESTNVFLHYFVNIWLHS